MPGLALQKLWSYEYFHHLKFNINQNLRYQGHQGSSLNTVQKLSLSMAASNWFCNYQTYDIGDIIEFN